MININYSSTRDSYDKHNIALIEFLKEYIITKKDKDYSEKINFCDIKTKTNYCIPNNKISDFTKLVNDCRLHHIPLNFTEYQKNSTIEERKGSGLFLDFDLYFNSEKDTLNNCNFTELINEILTTSINILDYNLNEYDDENTNNDGDDDEITLIMSNQIYVVYVAILKKEKVEYDEKKQQYKNGFHMIIPNILLSKDVRKYFITKLFENKKIKANIKKTNLINPDDFLDKNSAHVPHVLFGSSKVGKKPYILHSVSKVIIKKGYVEPVINVTEQFLNKDVNLVHEFNLNYRGSKNIIKQKQYVAPKKSILDKIKLYDEQIPDNGSDAIERMMEDLESDINTLCLDIVNMKYVKGLLEILSVNRLTDYGTWRDVIYVLANTSEQYHKLAHWVSARAKDVYDPNAVDKLWIDARNSNSANKSLTLRSLYFWARQDNPDRIKEFEDLALFNQINKDIHDKITEGKLNHYEFARYIYITHREKYVVDKSTTNGKLVWFEFVTSCTSCFEHGEIYKWRELPYLPNTISGFISEKLKFIITKNIEDLEKKIEASEGECNEIKYYQKLIKNTKSSTGKLSCSNFKGNVFKELQLMMLSSNFVNKLNLDANILGVGNGVLVLDNIYEHNGIKIPKLIKSYHEYKITNFTPVDYIPYNPESKYIQKMEELINDLFPPNEQDAKEFIMYFLASSLDFHAKESLLLICCGNGCHAIDTPIMMYDGSIKLVQDVKPNDLLMGDDNTPRTVLNLHNGKDIMVKFTINDKENTTFTVNMHHIISLKKQVFKNDKIFYKTFDICVKNLLTDNFNTKIYLYKLNDVNLYDFSLEVLSEDNYYGFELDNNRRYITTDKVVHHNSNGKSFLMDLLNNVLGEHYSKKISMDFFTGGRGKSSTADPEAMSLIGKRFAYSSESSPDDKLNVEKIKEYTGHERMSVRGLYQNQVNVKLHCNFAIITNHLPVIETFDHGSWRRFLFYNFKYKFVEGDPENEFEKKMDKNVSNVIKEDKRYQEALLSILVKYYIELQEKYNGDIKKLPHQTLITETDDYRNTLDHINNFIYSFIVINKKETIQFNIMILVNRYKEWYEQRIGKYTKSNKYIIDSFCNSIIRNHIHKLKHDDYACSGIRILEDDEKLRDGDIRFGQKKYKEPKN